MENELYKKLVELPYNNLYAKIILSALERDIFSNLEDEKTSDELSEKLQLDLINCNHFLNALYSMGLITKENKKYKNTKETNKYLTPNSPYYFGNHLKTSYKLNDIDFDYVDLVRNGKIEKMEVNENLDFSEMYDDMKNSQIGIRQKEVCELVSALDEYQNIKKILDLGCGAGLLGLSIISTRDDIEGVLFDLPPMGDLIKQCVLEKNLENRVEIKLGDYTKDDIGSKYDLIYASGTLTFAGNEIDNLLKKIYDSLNEGGVFMAILDEIDEDFSKPKEFVVSWLPYVLTGQNMYLMKDFIKDKALKAGFKNVSSEEKLLAFGHLNVVTFRK